MLGNQQVTKNNFVISDLAFFLASNTLCVLIWILAYIYSLSLQYASEEL